MAKRNHMLVSGKAVGNSTAQLKINLADDDKEVRGFGQPVTREMSRKMLSDYFDDIAAAETIIKEIETNKKYAELKEKKEFGNLKTLIDSENQTVSGVFGKEIILQILSMRGCEGIRYVIGKDKGKNTVVLIGVEEVAAPAGLEGVAPVMSKAIESTNEGAEDDIPIDAEVHGSSLTIAGADKILREGNESASAAEMIQSRVDMIFGTY